MEISGTVLCVGAIHESLTDKRGLLSLNFRCYPLIFTRGHLKPALQSYHCIFVQFHGAPRTLYLLSHSLFHFTLNITVGFLFRGDITLIIKFFTFTKSDLYFGPSFFEIDRQGDKG